MTARGAVFSLVSGSPSRSQRPLPPLLWTLIGGFAIPLWATAPALYLKTMDIPPFECLAIEFLFACLALSKTERAATRHSGQSALRPWIPALAFAIGESGSAVFFLLATHHIASAEANLIMYLWPGMIIGVGAALGLFPVKARQVVSIILGFAGVAILMGGATLSISYGGIGLALLAGMSWALYCVFRLRWRNTEALLARGFGISTLLCTLMHFVLEPTVVPSMGGAAAAAALGVIPAGLGNLAWDYGFRRGDSRLLAVLAYATPLCSALILVMLGIESLTLRLTIGALVIVAAGMLSRTD